MNTASPNNAKPLESMDLWEDFLKERYPEGKTEFLAETGKKATKFRNYETTARPSVREFYRLNHKYQTYDFNRAMETAGRMMGRRGKKLSEEDLAMYRHIFDSRR